jgi:hypothetical protein
MRIANPIYDVVFKFMMEDKIVAKTFISAIIGEEIVELDFTAQEYTVSVPIPIKNKNNQDTTKKEGAEGGEFPGCLTVCRLDFLAKIALPGGEYKTVLIELQKAKLKSDIMRFRRYLGRQYQNDNNAYEVNGETKARQTYCIFLLGYDILRRNHPVIHVDYSSKDATTSEVLDKENDFIQSLHHRSWIVQINQLEKHHRNNLDKLLSIFDQNNIVGNVHILNVEDEENFPAIYRPIVRRLRMACNNEEMQIQMEMEDDYLKELQDNERRLEEKDKAIEEQKKINEELRSAFEGQKNAFEEQKKINEEQSKAFEEFKKQIEEKLK